MGFVRRLIDRKSSADASSSSSGQALPSALSRFEVGWATDAGRVRDHNEDTVLVIKAAQGGGDGISSFGLFVLADGMGGHQAGEVASSVAARVSARHVARESYLPSLLDQEQGAKQPDPIAVLVDAVRAANDAVSEKAPQSGTTLICALVLDRQAYIANVGDSRAYVLTEEGLEQITRDHSVVDRMVDSGQLTPEEAAKHPQKNVLYRVVGQGGALEVDTYVPEMQPGEYLLLCSDGLWGLVDEADIIDVIRRASSLQGACEDLIAAANESGGRDNITAILWRSPLG